MLVSLSIPLYISLIKSTNNKGPRMEPCGTPDRTSINSELQLSKITCRAANPCPAWGGGDDQHILVTFLILGG